MGRSVDSRHVNRNTTVVTVKSRHFNRNTVTTVKPKHNPIPNTVITSITPHQPPFEPDPPQTRTASSQNKPPAIRPSYCQPPEQEIQTFRRKCGSAGPSGWFMHKVWSAWVGRVMTGWVTGLGWWMCGCWYWYVLRVLGWTEQECMTRDVAVDVHVVVD